MSYANAILDLAVPNNTVYSVIVKMVDNSSFLVSGVKRYFRILLSGKKLG